MHVQMTFVVSKYALDHFGLKFVQMIPCDLKNVHMSICD